MKIRLAQNLTDAERTALFGWDADAFDVDALNLQWRRKDWHVVVEADGQPVSHAGFIKRQSIKVDGQQIFVGGVGGVVTVPRARRLGFASAAVREAERYISDDPSVDFAMLFCQEPLTGFYSRQGWLRLRGTILILQDNGACASPLPAMIKCIRQTVWPEGTVAVDGHPW